MTSAPTESTVRKRVKRWPPETRDTALAVYAKKGLAAAVRETGVPKGTIATWRKKAGLPSATPEVVAQATAAADASNAVKRSLLEEARALHVARLIEITNKALERELEELKKPDLPLPAIVGSRTRAIHDLQLLTGEDTERGGAGTFTVHLHVPRPEKEPKVIKQEDLGREGSK